MVQGREVGVNDWLKKDRNKCSLEKNLSHYYREYITGSLLPRRDTLSVNRSPRINPGDFPGPSPIQVPASPAHAFPGCHSGLVLPSLHRQWPRVPGPTIAALQPGWILRRCGRARGGPHRWGSPTHDTLNQANQEYNDNSSMSYWTGTNDQF